MFSFETIAWNTIGSRQEYIIRPSMVETPSKDEKFKFVFRIVM